jgi:hypothetical protein
MMDPRTERRLLPASRHETTSQTVFVAAQNRPRSGAVFSTVLLRRNKNALSTPRADPDATADRRIRRFAPDSLDPRQRLARSYPFDRQLYDPIHLLPLSRYRIATAPPKARNHTRRGNTWRGGNHMPGIAARQSCDVDDLPTLCAFAITARSVLHEGCRVHDGADRVRRAERWPATGLTRFRGVSPSRITVSAARTPTSAFAVPLAVTVVSRQALEERNGFRLDEAFEAVPRSPAMSRTWAASG